MCYTGSATVFSYGFPPRDFPSEGENYMVPLAIEQ